MDNDQIIPTPEEFVKAGMIYRMAKGDIRLGYEWAARGPDEIDERIHEHIDRLIYSEQNEQPITILDLGCAHGTRLARLAHLGVTCVGVDILDQSESIANHNKVLKAQQKPQITFIQSDLRKLEAADFAADKFAVINCSLAMHFMNRDDILHMLQFIKDVATPKTLITVSLNTNEIASTHPMVLQMMEIPWRERQHIMKVLGYIPGDNFDYRIYEAADMAIAMELVGLKLHDNISRERGTTVQTASLQGGALFDPRAGVGLVNRARAYLGLTR